MCGGCKFKAKISYRVMKLIKEIQDHMDIFNKSRTEVLEKFGEKSEDNLEQVKINPENIKEFNIEFGELMSEKVEIKIPELSIDDMEDIEIEPVHLMTLDWIFDKEE